LSADNDEDFTGLVERQARFVFRVAYAVLLNAHDAEDAVQEVFLKLYRNGGWRNIANERAFLARVTWRVCLDRRRPSGPSVSQDSDQPLDPPSTAPDPEQSALAANRQAAVHALIDRLPEDLRMPLVLSAFDELNSREIAAILFIPEGTVRTRLQRARQLLRQKLDALENAHTQEPRNA
jgi:RNA polymerase sigma-70 factor (ECF subfamily)